MKLRAMNCRSLVVLILLVPLTACSDDGFDEDGLGDDGSGDDTSGDHGSDDDSEAPVCADELALGQALPEGQAVIGCGLPPGIGLIAVEGGRAYTMSKNATYFANDVVTEAPLRLYHDVRASLGQDATWLALRAAAHDGALYFQSRFLNGNYLMDAVLSIPGGAPTSDEAASVVIASEQYEAHSPMLEHGDRLYAGSVVHEGDSTYSGPVVEIDIDAGTIQPITSEYGTPVGLVDGMLYYCHDSEITRVAVSGGSAELIVEAKGPSGCFGHAVDEDYIYMTTDDAPYEIWRFGVGGVEQLIHTAFVDPEVPIGPPRDLRRDGEWLYYLQGGTLWRVQADGDGEAESVTWGSDLTPPVFDAANIYVALSRGGSESPLEGVILRIEKSSLDGD